MPHTFLLDSGAFSAWSRNATIDLEAYTAFCANYYEDSYFVSLDVIPKSIRDKSIRNDVEDCCKQGWQNYKRMIQEVPKERVIPVYHKNENPKWLEQYLELGCPYVGIGGLVGSTAAECIHAMKKVRHLLFDKAGNPTVRVHGFGVTSFTVMKYWQWYSVDSTSWLVTANLGGVYIPRTTRGIWDYSKPPIVVAFSPKSPVIGKRGAYIDNMTPHMREGVIQYLQDCKMPIGKVATVVVPESYKLERGNEVWVDSRKRSVLRTVEPGLASSYDLRRDLNARFIKKANRELPVNHIYFAGNLSGPDHPLEPKLTHRLMSFIDIEKEKKSKQTFELHMEIIRKQRESM